MSCARCGCGIYKTEEFISLNKVWHKYCFTCFQCNKCLDKDTAKIFQGELFCQCCYSSVIEKLFEVISTPSVRKPSRVVSTPSCTVSKSLLQKLVTCRPCPGRESNCANIEVCFPKENKCPNDQRTVRSCSCIPNQPKKNEFCFTLPLPREVANYYNRTHMKNRNCYNKPCCKPPQCQNVCCAGPKPKVTVRTCKNQSFYESCPPPPRCSNPRKCCCTKPPPCAAVFTKDCDCCQEDHCCYSCQSPHSPCPPQASPCPPRASPYQPCRYCRNQPCPRAQCTSTPKCCCSRPAPIQWCPPSDRCPPKPQCCPPKPQCCPPKAPRCPPKPQCYSPKPQACSCNCKAPPPCYPPAPKYCVCGSRNPCNCKMSEIRALCTICCKRCNKKVYAAEKIQVTAGAYHTNCFTCYCCNKCLDVKNLYEGCGEIYCKQCYNYFFNIQYYGF